MAALWHSLADHTSWLALTKLRESFLSKVTTAFAFTTFALANFAGYLDKLGIDLWRLRFLFVGAVLFLMGYLVVGWRVPNELRSVESLDELVSRMLTISDFRYFETRRKMASALALRMEGRKPFDLPDGYLDYVRVCVADTANDCEWQEQHAATLYHADLALRQYDRPKARVTAFVLLGFGLLLLLIPTFEGIWRVVKGQLAG